MRVAHLDCFSGIAGDMLLGAMVGCGLDLDDLRRDLAGLALDGYRLGHRRVRRGALTADKVDVLIEGDRGAWFTEHEHLQGERGPGEQDQGDDRHDHDDGEHGHRHGHHDPGVGEHDHAHEGHAQGDDPYGRGGAGSGWQGSSAPPHGHRGLRELREILEASDLPAGVAEDADRVFVALCAAEAAVHGVAVEEVHLHEVGAIDAIVDIVGACAGLRRLGIGSLTCSPLNVGGGQVEAAHGVLPVPAPATAHLLRGVPVYSRGPSLELVTPTGAAIVTTLGAGFGPWPRMKVQAVGYGAGDRELEGLPNVVRMVVGEPGDGPHDSGHPGPIAVVETNIDDMNPQLYGHVVARLLEAGALDAYVTPVFMKKNRPGAQLTVLVPRDGIEPIADLLFAETTTLGVRIHAVERRELQRSSIEVRTPWGPVRVKLGRLGERIVNAAPEYDDCEALAARAGVPVKDVLQAAVAAYRLSINRDSEEAE